MRRQSIILLFCASMLPGLAAAADEACAVDIDATDALQFSVKEITVDKSCKEFTVNLKHVGKMPVNTMGHNWVLTTEADMAGVAQDGISAGLDNDYLKPGDERVIAHTELIGGGQQTSVTFDVSKLQAGQSYMFFCSFPGHSAIMKGPLKVGG